MIRCPFNKAMTCGVYQDLKDWDQWGNERFCRKFCEHGRDKTGMRRRVRSQERFQRERRPYQQRIRGRRVA